jgi:hypothetical protein
MKHSSNRLSALGLALVGAITLLAAACNSDNKNSTPTTPSNGQGGGAATGGAPADATGGSDTSVATGGAPSTDATGGAAATGGAPGVGGTSSTSTAPCTHDPAKTCYECTPTTNDQILEACSNATCYPFDNTARGVPATLPAIP